MNIKIKKMEIIAKTDKGVLINATKKEVIEILNAVTGEKPKELRIGQKIPAIDYASTILKIQALSENYDYRQIIEHSNRFSEHVEDLRKIIDSTKNILL